MKSLNRMTAEFARTKGSRDKKKRQRSLKDNVLGTTTAGRVARGVGAAGVLVGAGLLGAKALRKVPQSQPTQKLLGGSNNPKLLPGRSNTKIISSTSSANKGSRVENYPGSTGVNRTGATYDGKKKELLLSPGKERRRNTTRKTLRMNDNLTSPNSRNGKGWTVPYIPARLGDL